LGPSANHDHALVRSSRRSGIHGGRGKAHPYLADAEILELLRYISPGRRRSDPIGVLRSKRDGSSCGRNDCGERVQRSPHDGGIASTEVTWQIDLLNGLRLLLLLLGLGGRGLIGITNLSKSVGRVAGC